MKSLNNEEMMNVNGGAKWGIIAIIGGFITFIAGMVDGFLNPYTR